MTDTRSPTPHWPALLDDALAAAFMCMSEDSLATVAALHGVRKVNTGLRLSRWKLKDLEALVDRLPYRGQLDAPPIALKDPGSTALDRVRRRVRGGHEERQSGRRA